MTRNAIEHLDAADHLISLVSVALRLRHPSAAKMATIDMERILRLTDEQIDVLTSRLELWIAEQPGAIAAPKAGA